MRLFFSVTGNVLNTPPPCTVMPGLAVSLLWVTALLASVSCTVGGPSGMGSFQIPPPWSTPLGPTAVPVLLLMVVSRRVNALMFRMPAPWATTDPVVVVAVTMLPLMMLSRMVPMSGAAVRIAPAVAIAVSVGAFAQLLAIGYPERALSITLISTSPATAAERSLPLPTERFNAFLASAEVDWSERRSVIDYLIGYSECLRAAHVR